MGWKDRDWYLGDHAGPLFDRNGNIDPTVWVDGRIVGGWGQTPSGEIVVCLLEDIGSDYQSLVDLQASVSRDASATRSFDPASRLRCRSSFPHRTDRFITATRNSESSINGRRSHVASSSSISSAEAAASSRNSENS